MVRCFDFISHEELMCRSVGEHLLIKCDTTTCCTGGLLEAASRKKTHQSDSGNQ